MIQFTLAAKVCVGTMNFLFFGLGSIGQRHLRNLIKIEKKSKIYAYRKKYSTPLLDHRNKVLKGNLEKKYIEQNHTFQKIPKIQY